MIEAPTPWRSLLYRRINALTLSGVVLDLGGSRQARYHELIKGSPSFTVVDIQSGPGVDIVADLEEGIPVPDGICDGVVAFNLLEHIFNHQGLLNESYRALKTDGKLVLAVPFLLPPHASPHDYFRYTKEALEKIVREAGFRNVTVEAIGTGPFGAAMQSLYVPLHFSLLRKLAVWKGTFLDWVLRTIFPGRNFREQFPLGFFVEAIK